MKEILMNYWNCLNSSVPLVCACNPSADRKISAKERNATNFS